MTDHTTIMPPDGSVWDGPYTPDGPIWTPLSAKPLTNSLLWTSIPSELYTGLTGTPPDPFIGSPSDVYTGYQVGASRGIQLGWFQIFGDVYGGGHPDSDRIYEYLTSPTEPFPSLNGISAPYSWFDEWYTPTSTSGYFGDSFSHSPNAWGNWRRYASATSQSAETGGQPALVYKWMGSGYHWSDTTGPGGFAPSRFVKGSYDTSVSVRKANEITNVLSYEDLEPGTLKSGLTAFAHWGSDLLTGINDLLAFNPLYELRRGVAFDSGSATVNGARMIFRVHHANSQKIESSAAGVPERFYIYTKTSSYPQTYPWSPWTGTLVGHVDLTYAYDSTYTTNGFNGPWVDANPIEVSKYTATGASFSFGTVTTRFESADWTTYVISGLDIADFSQGGYVEVQVIPYHYFNEPSYVAAMVSDSVSTNFYHSSSLTFSVDWETQVTLPQFWHLKEFVPGPAPSANAPSPPCVQTKIWGPNRKFEGLPG